MSTTAMSPRPVRLRTLVGAFLIVLLAGGAVAARGVLSRKDAHAALRTATEEQAILNVRVTRPAMAPRTDDLVLPGNVQAYTDAPIYARADGYVARWLVDIGATVKAGQLMAELETPEVDQALRQAQADLATAEANARLAESTAARWKELLVSQSVSRQSVDEKVSDAAAKKALLESARANVNRLKELQSFKHIVAPFDGVVTARNIDIGTLVDAGGGAGHELFRLAKTDRLRVYVQIPQPYTTALTVGTAAELELAERPGRRYAATLVRTASALDPASRTLRAELEVENAGAEIFAGSYARVHFELPESAGVIRLPVNTLLFRPDGVHVGTVSGQSIALRKVTLGRDFGSEIEITSGLDPEDLVVMNPPDSLAPEQPVRIAQAPPAG